jgi:hypothetical protein
MADKLIIVDANVFRTLYQVGGTSALDTLFAANIKIGLQYEFKSEWTRALSTADKDIVNSWVSANKIAGRLLDLPPTSIPDPGPGQHWGELAYREFTNNNQGTYETRLLSNDRGGYNFEVLSAPSPNAAMTDPTKLSTPGQYARPYMGYGEFLQEQVSQRNMSTTTATYYADAIRATPGVWNSIPSSRAPFQQQFLTSEGYTKLAAEPPVSFGTVKALGLGGFTIVMTLFDYEQTRSQAAQAQAAGVPFGAEEAWSKFFARLYLGTTGFETGFAAGATTGPWTALAGGALLGGIYTIGGQAAVDVLFDAARYVRTVFSGGPSASQLLQMPGLTVVQQDLLAFGITGAKADVLLGAIVDEWHNHLQINPSASLESVWTSTKLTTLQNRTLSNSGAPISGSNGETLSIVSLPDGTLGIARYDLNGNSLTVTSGGRNGTPNVIGLRWGQSTIRQPELTRLLSASSLILQPAW